MMKNSKQDNFNVFFTRLVVFTAVALLVFVIVLLAIGIASKGKSPANVPDTTSIAPESTDDPNTTNTPESTDAPITKKPPQTTNPPETTAPPDDTTASGFISGEVPNTVVDWERFNSSTSTLKKTEDMGKEYIDSIIFLGDSTTNGLRAYGVLSDGLNTKQVWTGASGTLTLDNTIMNKTIYYPDMGKEVTIIEAVKDKKPEIMVVTLGVNGISFSTEEQFKTNYTNLVLGIKEASPDTKIILQSIFPVTKAYDEDETTRIKNEKIRAANEWIISIAEKYNFKFLNTTYVLQGADGTLIEKYCNDAKLHLNEIGLQTELQYIRTHAYTK